MTLDHFMELSRLGGVQNITILALGKDDFGVDIENVRPWWNRHHNHFNTIQLVIAHPHDATQPPTGPHWGSTPLSQRSFGIFDLDILIQNAAGVRNDLH